MPHVVAQLLLYRLEEQFKLEHAIKTQHKQAKKRQKITKNLWKKDEKVLFTSQSRDKMPHVL